MKTPKCLIILACPDGQETPQISLYREPEQIEAFTIDGLSWAVTEHAQPLMRGEPLILGSPPEIQLEDLRDRLPGMSVTFFDIVIERRRTS